MITNQDKPSGQTPQTELNIGSGFNLFVGGVYKLIVGAVGLGGMTNSSKVSVGETWATVSTTWDTETRTWLAVSQLLSNNSKPTTADPLWTSQLVWQMSLPWQSNSGVMNNLSKP